MKKSQVFRLAAVAAVIAGAQSAALATNGMVLEGYGPVSTSMGGASQAIDHGTAGMAQNPATLSMMADGSRLEVAIGFLGPKITASMATMPDASSGGTSYMMPAIGYTRKAGALTYGIGMYAIGGMGTEYSTNSFMGGMGPARSELGVGSVIFPLSYQVNPNLAIGGSLDFVWATMDLQMNATATDMQSMMTGGNMTFPGTMAFGRIDFSDNDKFSGAAKANGYRGKIGLTYKVNDAVVLGGSYQSKTSLSDMQTATGSASMSVYDGTMTNLGTYGGKMTVQNFQWPAITAIGASWKASPALMLAADVKSIGWAEVMKNFNMRFDAGGAYATLSMPQNWKDQTVYSLGVAYKTSPELTLRAGVNMADSPIPAGFVSALFPATVQSHYTLGAGYEISKNQALHASYTMTPEATGSWQGAVTTKHSQSNWQFLYSHRF